MFDQNTVRSSCGGVTRGGWRSCGSVDLESAELLVFPAPWGDRM